MDPDPDPRKEIEVDPDPDLDPKRGLKWIRIRNAGFNNTCNNNNNNNDMTWNKLINL